MLINPFIPPQSSKNKTPIPSYNKTNQKSSSTASKDYLEERSANEIESSYSQHKLPTVPLIMNSESYTCDSESHRSFAIEYKDAPLIGSTPLTENGFIFNITYIPASVPMQLDNTSPLTDTKDQGNTLFYITFGSLVPNRHCKKLNAMHTVATYSI